MEQLILNKLPDRKHSFYRKPMILKGLRQVGKVNLMRIDPMSFTKFLLANGGMPEPVLMWTEVRGVTAMQETLSGIHCSAVWRSWRLQPSKGATTRLPSSRVR